MERKNFSGGLNSLLQPTAKSTPLNKRKQEKRVKKELTRIIAKTSQEGTKPGETRATFIVKEDILEKLKALAFWDRKQIKAVIQEAFESFINSRSESEVKRAVKLLKERRSD